MASITTILGTDSVSSSRIVINNNFNALNTELGTVASLLNTTAQTLTLTGEIKGGTLKVFNGSLNTLEVTASDITARVETTFTDKVLIQKALVLNIASVTVFPTTYEASTYILDASVLTAASYILPATDDGIEVTFVAENAGTITLDQTNIAGVTALVVINQGGSVTLRYSVTNSEYYVVSAMNATVTY